MPKRKWKDLSPRTRKVILAGAAFDGTLKVVALIDLARRPSSEIRGSKVAWATAVVVLNSVGLVPIFYLTRGRRR